MTLLMLTFRCRDYLHYMWIEDITLLIYDLSFCWKSLMLRIFHSLFVISLFVDLVELADIQYLMIDF